MRKCERDRFLSRARRNLGSSIRSRELEILAKAAIIQSWTGRQGPSRIAFVPDAVVFDARAALRPASDTI